MYLETVILTHMANTTRRLKNTRQIVKIRWQAVVRPPTLLQNVLQSVWNPVNQRPMPL